MVDVGRIKNRFGRPPDPSQAGKNLTEPEPWVDGRSLRATGRTVQFATRIRPEYHRKAKMIAARDGITLAELFEKGLDAYERERGS